MHPALDAGRISRDRRMDERATGQERVGEQLTACAVQGDGDSLVLLSSARAEMAVVHTLSALGFLQRVDSEDHRDGFMPIGTLRFGIQQP